MGYENIGWPRPPAPAPFILTADERNDEVKDYSDVWERNEAFPSAMTMCCLSQESVHAFFPFDLYTVFSLYC